MPSRSISLATQNALNFCTILINGERTIVIDSSHNTLLHDLLINRISLNPETLTINLPSCADPEGYENHINNQSNEIIVFIQPDWSQMGIINKLIIKSKPICFLILQASWLGTRLLPEWEAPPIPYHELTSYIRKKYINDPRLISENISVGNLKSLFWGFLSGHLKLIGRSDLMDQYMSRCRFHLFPELGKKRFTYISLTRITIANKT